MKNKTKLAEWSLGLLGIAIFLTVLWCVGAVYRSSRLLWATLWLALPLLSFVISARKLDSHLTEKGMKTFRVFIMIFAVGMSGLIFFDPFFKESFGHHFVRGSQVWLADKGDTDDFGKPIASLEYYAPTTFGRLVLWSYDWIVVGLCILIPYLLYRSLERPIRVKEKKRLRRDYDGEFLEK